MPVLKEEVPRFEQGENLTQRVEQMHIYLQRLHDRLEFLLQQLQTTKSTQEMLNKYITAYDDELALKGYVTATDLAESGRTVINGGNIQTGVIESENGKTTLDLTSGEFTFGRNDGDYGYLANGQLFFRKNILAGAQNAGMYLYPWLGDDIYPDGLVQLIGSANAQQGIADVPFYAAGIASGADSGFTPGYVLNNGLDPSGYEERNLFYGSTRFIGPVADMMREAKLLWRNPDESTFAATTLQMSDMLDYLGNYNCFIVACHQTSDTTPDLRIVTGVLNMKDYPLYGGDWEETAITGKLNVVDTALDNSWRIIVRQRTFTFDRANGTVAISTGYYGNNGTSGGSYASTMVPISIYGLNI